MAIEAAISIAEVDTRVAATWHDNLLIKSVKYRSLRGKGKCMQLSEAAAFKTPALLKHLGYFFTQFLGYSCWDVFWGFWWFHFNLFFS